MADAPRYWEDVREGEEISLEELMSTQRLVLWAAATSSFYPVHFDEEFARKNQLPGVIVQGSLKGMLVGRLLEEWVGRTGRIVRWELTYREMDLARAELTIWARVVRKYRVAESARVDLEVGVRGWDAADGTLGSATVALPERAASTPVP
jgi:acyl dehydratase